MYISRLKPSIVIDSDRQDEVIHFDVNVRINGKYAYTRYRQLTSDFNGNPILKEDEYIRVKSIWLADLTTGSVEQLVPYGNFDMEWISVASSYVYFLKVLDKDRDGRLGDNDYWYGTELWRVSLESKTAEFCLDCKNYNFHGFDVVNDWFVVFRSEDRLPDDMTELIFVDMQNRRKASLVATHDDGENNFNFEFVQDNNGNPTHFITKRWIFEAEPSSLSHTMNCIAWNDLIGQLEWESIV